METLKGSMQVINEYSYYEFIKTSRRTNAGFLLFIHALKFSLSLEYKQNKLSF